MIQVKQNHKSKYIYCYHYCYHLRSSCFTTSSVEQMQTLREPLAIQHSHGLLVLVHKLKK